MNEWVKNRKKKCCAWDREGERERAHVVNKACVKPSGKKWRIDHDDASSTDTANAAVLLL